MEGINESVKMLIGQLPHRNATAALRWRIARNWLQVSAIIDKFSPVDFAPSFSRCLGKLYFSTARQQPFDTQSCKVLNIDNAYLYEGYNSDFGPLTLNFVHKFVKEVDSLSSKYS